MATSPRQVWTVARKIGRQHRSDVLLHNLICFLDSIAECREEYTSEDICQQGSDNTETRDPVEMVGAAGVLQEMLQRLRKLESSRYRYVCLGQLRPSIGFCRRAECCRLV
jgi:hypothetical protein